MEECFSITGIFVTSTKKRKEQLFFFFLSPKSYRLCGMRDDIKTEGGIWDDRTFNDGMRDYNRRRDKG